MRSRGILRRDGAPRNHGGLLAEHAFEVDTPAVVLGAHARLIRHLQRMISGQEGTLPHLAALVADHDLVVPDHDLGLQDHGRERPTMTSWSPTMTSWFLTPTSYLPTMTAALRSTTTGSQIKSNQAEYGEAAGITATDLKNLLTADEQCAQIVAQLPAATKLVEILIESKAAIDDKRQRMISAFAQSAESRAKANGNGAMLLAKYEKTRAYRSAIAEKGAKTRRKNEAAAEAQKTEEESKAAANAAPKT